MLFCLRAKEFVPDGGGGVVVDVAFCGRLARMLMLAWKALARKACLVPWRDACVSLVFGLASQARSRRHLGATMMSDWAVRHTRVHMLRTLS